MGEGGIKASILHEGLRKFGGLSIGKSYTNRKRVIAKIGE